LQRSNIVKHIIGSFGLNESNPGGDPLPPVALKKAILLRRGARTYYPEADRKLGAEPAARD